MHIEKYRYVYEYHSWTKPDDPRILSFLLCFSQIRFPQCDASVMIMVMVSKGN